MLALSQLGHLEEGQSLRDEEELPLRPRRDPWFSASAKERDYTFNVPFLDERPRRQGKTEFKKVTNVWADIELVNRPERSCRRPLPMIGRLIKAHSNPGDLVVDFFSGYGTTGIVAHNLGRRFLGCEQVEADAIEADRRVTAARAKDPGAGRKIASLDLVTKVYDSDRLTESATERLLNVSVHAVSAPQVPNVRCG